MCKLIIFIYSDGVYTKKNNNNNLLIIIPISNVKRNMYKENFFKKKEEYNINNAIYISPYYKYKRNVFTLILPRSYLIGS